jgi:triphosphatase
MSNDPPAIQEDEKEIKLRVRRAHVPLLSRHHLVTSSAKTPPSKRRLVSVYYDTPDHRLYANGLTLRVRRGRGANTQTVKSGLAADGLTRQEWHRQIAGRRPQLDGFPDPALGHRLHAIIGTRPLRPVFTTDVERTAWMLDLPQGDRVELALDVGKLTAGRRKIALCEAELELKSGDGARLFDLAQSLQETVPFEVTNQSKSSRGYALAAGALPAPVKIAGIEIAASATAEQAFKAIVRNCLDQLAANEAGAKLGHDMEYVHQMRVALRRLRTAIGLFAPMPAGSATFDAAAETRWLAQQLGPARDWDVFITETLMPLGKEYRRESGLRRLAVMARGQRRQAYDAARAALAESRYTAFQLAFGQWLARPDSGAPADGLAETGPAQPAADFAREALARQWKKLNGLARRHESLSVEQWHRLRILAKRLRYTVDFFRSFLDRKEANRLYEGLGEIQDRLGTLNDADIGRKLLVATLAANAGARTAVDDASLARAASLVDGWYAARATMPPKGFGRSWKRLADRLPDWKRAKRA